MSPTNKEMAAAFLEALEGDRFTFQTFDDSKAKNQKLARIIHGTIEECYDELAKLNKSGAGVFVTVNETDLRGRTAANVISIRALFVDLDGAPLEPVLEDKTRPPHIVVESSPGRWHAYWLVNQFPLASFTGAQKALAKKFNSDPKVCDLPRVMRLPGFLHKKSDPFLTAIVDIGDHGVYGEEVFDIEKEESKLNGVANLSGRMGSDPGRINDLALESLASWVPVIFPEAKSSKGIYRVPSKALGRKLEEDLSISPQGIKDFGVHDMGDKRGGNRTAIDLVMEHMGKTFDEALRWLRNQLGYRSVELEDFWAYLPQHTYIYTPTGEQWPAVSVNACIRPIPITDSNDEKVMVVNKEGEATKKQQTMTASSWLDRHRRVHQLTWAPGEPQIIRDRLIVNGGWSEQIGTASYNEYLAANIALGDAHKASQWTDHILKVYPDDATHIILYLAQRVQQPHIKPNHALVLGGKPGIGKDTILEPVKYAVGPWNFAEITPQTMLGRFNGFVKSVILRISEARDLEVNRYQFYDSTKIYMASPPDVLRCDEKNLREHYVTNCCGVIITTNYKTDGIYLPANDRRHYVAWSDVESGGFDDEYWNHMWRWYHMGGFGHVAAYLSSIDISAYNPKAPPPKTPAFWDIVDANQAPEDSELRQIMEELGNLPAVTNDMVAFKADDTFRAWLKDRKNRRAIPHRFEQCGYSPMRNDVSEDGRWRIAGRRLVVYARIDLSMRERLAAASALATKGGGGPVAAPGNNDIPF